MAPRGRSTVWKHFVNLSTKQGKCKTCGEVIERSGNTANLWQHLKRKHNQAEGPPSSPTGEDERNPDDPDTLDGEDPNQQPQARPAKRPRQPTLVESLNSAKSYAAGCSKDVELCDALLFMVCKDNMPLMTPEKEGFRHFAKKAAPLWRPPSRKKLTAMLEEKFEKSFKATRDTIAGLESYCMSADVWTETHTSKSYLGVTLHYLDGDDDMCMVRIGLRALSQAHTAAYLQEIIEDICEKWGIVKEKVTLFLTDNAENIKKAVKDAFGGKVWQPCFAHTINLVAEAPFKTWKDKVTNQIIEAVIGLNALINKVKKIVTFFKHSVKSADKLRKLQMDMGRTQGTILMLIQEVSTRWNSKYLMLERFLLMSPLVSTVLLELTDAPPMLTGRELQTCRVLMEVLAPFYQITVELSGDQIPTASNVIPLINLTRQVLPTVDTGNDPLATATKTLLIHESDMRFKDIEKLRRFAAATLLDPRYKTLHFTTLAADAKALIASELKEVLREEQGRREAAVAALRAAPEPVADTEDNSRPTDLWKLHAKIASTQAMYGEDEVATAVPLQLRQFLKKPVLDQKGNPLEQWKVLKAEYPELHVVAKRYLSIISTSVPSERYFSRAGIVCSDLRTRLTEEHLAQLLFLGSLSIKQWNSC